MAEPTPDPRGPERTITAVDGGPKGNKALITLSCGHVRSLNPIYSYRVGDRCRCFACKVLERHP